MFRLKKSLQIFDDLHIFLNANFAPQRGPRALILFPSKFGALVCGLMRASGRKENWGRIDKGYGYERLILA